MMMSLQKILAKIPFKLPFQQLQPRERIILLVGAAALIFIILIRAVFFPVIDHRSRLNSLIKTQTTALAEIEHLRAEFENLSGSNQFRESRLKQRQPGFTLFSFLETLAGRTGIKQHIVSMKPSTTNLKNSPYTLSMVEMKIDGLSMEQLVAFLHGIETADQMVWIKGISISKNENKNSVINTVLQAETLQR